MATVEPPFTIAAVEQLYLEHGEHVRAICASILRNRQEAEDAAQQVFVSALRALQSGVEPRDPGAWLATIARHESWARARRDAPVRLVEDLEDVAQEDPAATAIRRKELADAWHTIAELPPSQRTALLLREVRGLGYDEVADDLNVSRASVRSLLSRARRTLRTQLEKGAAALTGAPWLSVFARLFGDASTPAVSSATRTAAVGLGALVVTSGAIVAPTLSHHARAPHDPPVRSEHAARRVRSPATALPRVAAAVPIRATTIDRHGAVSSRRSDDTRHGGHASVTEDRSGRSGSRDGGGATRDGSSSRSGEGSGSTSDGGGSTNSGPGSPSTGESSGSSGRDGSSGSGHTDDGS